MGNAVIPRQQGDDYQAKIFWLRACDLLRASTNVAKVGWEVNTTFGFDDVVVYYDPAKLDKGEYVIEECFQVKFHVDHSSGFSCSAIIDPAFIGATEESLLKRLYNIYRQDPAKFKSCRFSIINTWGLEKGDLLGGLLDNAGALRLEKLFDGSTDKSATGRIRKAWREHLKIASDDELKSVVAPLRILHSYDNIDRLKDNLNKSFELVGFKPILAAQRSSPYTDLIQKLHLEKRNVFTKEELLEIIQTEGLIADERNEPEKTYPVGIRTFRRGAETLESETDQLVCLLRYFSGRFINDENSWEKDIFPAVQALAHDIVQQSLPITIHLDTHLSVAFSLGYFIGNKTGKDISIVQKNPAGRLLWRPELNSLKPATDSLWHWHEESLNPQGTNTILVLSVTHDIYNEVKQYAQAEISTASKIIHAAIKPRPSGSAIKDANHILQAVEEIVSKLRSSRSVDEKKGNLHIFLAAPNAFAFFLGQYGSTLGQIVLYEFDFEHLKTGTYTKIIHLPIN